MKTLEEEIAEIKDNQKSKSVSNNLPSNTNEKDSIDTIFPMLANYRQYHTSNDLKKLCLELVEFCNQLYASTKSEEERRIYCNMVEKLKK